MDTDLQTGLCDWTPAELLGGEAGSAVVTRRQSAFPKSQAGGEGCASSHHQYGGAHIKPYTHQHKP